MWELTSDERHKLAKGGEHLDQNLQTKKQLFSIYKEEAVLRKRFEEVLSYYDEDDVHGNASGATQRMDQALAERRRYFSVNAVSTPPEKRLALPSVLTSLRSFQKPVLKPMERTLFDGVSFGNFPALSSHFDTNKGANFEVTDVEAKKEGTSVNSEKVTSNDILISLQSPRSFVQQKRGQLPKDRFDSVEAPRMAIQPSRKKRSLSFPSSSVIHRPVVRGTRGRRISFASSWKTKLHRRPYLVIP